MASRKTAPPKFKEDVAYKTWKNKLSMWTLVTNVPKKEQAIVVLHEALEGNQKAEKAVSDLTATQLNVDDGLKVLLDKLDTAFQAETTDDAYSAYTEFNNYKKGHNTSMNDYILEFEHLNHKILEYDMKLPDTVLAFNSSPEPPIGGFCFESLIPRTANWRACLSSSGSPGQPFGDLTLLAVFELTVSLLVKIIKYDDRLVFVLLIYAKNRNSNSEKFWENRALTFQFIH